MIMFAVSHLYGFGLMDAFEMVRAAETWMPVPPKHTCIEQSNRRARYSICPPECFEPASQSLSLSSGIYIPSTFDTSDLPVILFFN